MSSDPLKLAQNHTGPLFTTVEIPATFVAALTELRDLAGFVPALTPRFLGQLLTEALSKAAGGLEALPKLLGETPIYFRLRNALGVLTAEGKVWLARTDLSEKSGVSPAMVTLFVKWGVAAGVLEESFGSSSTGRAAKVVRLTTLGLRHGEKDHPDHSVRFVLGGMIPEPSQAALRVATSPEEAKALLGAGFDHPVLRQASKPADFSLHKLHPNLHLDRGPRGPVVEEIPESVLAGYTPEPEGMDPDYAAAVAETEASNKSWNAANAAHWAQEDQPSTSDPICGKPVDWAGGMRTCGRPPNHPGDCDPNFQ